MLEAFLRYFKDRAHSQRRFYDKNFQCRPGQGPPYNPTISEFRNLFFDAGALIANFFFLPMEIDDETEDIHIGIQPAPVEPHVRAAGAVRIIGAGLYKNFQVLVDYANKLLVLGKFK